MSKTIMALISATVTALAVLVPATAAQAAATPLPKTWVYAPSTYATLYPKVAVPKGAKIVVPKRITVRKDGVVIARNVAKRTVRLGTYRVWSTVTYRPLVTSTKIRYGSFDCRVSARTLVSNRTTLQSPDYLRYWYGQITVRYTGTCNAGYPSYAKFAATWLDDHTVLVDDGLPLMSDYVVAKVGDVEWVTNPRQIVKRYGAERTAATVRTVEVYR